MRAVRASGGGFLGFGSGPSTAVAGLAIGTHGDAGRGGALAVADGVRVARFGLGTLGSGVGGGMLARFSAASRCSGMAEAGFSCEGPAARVELGPAAGAAARVNGWSGALGLGVLCCVLVARHGAVASSREARRVGMFMSGCTKASCQEAGHGTKEMAS